GPELAHTGHRLASVLGLRGDLEIVLRLEDQPEAASDERLVVGNDDRDHAIPASSGSRTRSAKPPSSRGPAAISPPKTGTRSRMPARPCPPTCPFEPPGPSSTTSSSSACSPYRRFTSAGARPARVSVFVSAS